MNANMNAVHARRQAVPCMNDAHVDDSCVLGTRLTPMTRPGELLEELLRKRGITPTEFGDALEERAGYESGYRLVRGWITGRGFDHNRRNQMTAAQILGVEPDYFTAKTAVQSAVIRDVRMEGLRRYLELVGDDGITDEELEILVGAQDVFGDDDPGAPEWASMHGVARGVIARRNQRLASAK